MKEIVDLVSIVTPSYNASAFIGATIESVIAQNYQNWELLVIDDGSRDSTTSVVSSYQRSDKRIRLIALEKNHGAPAAPRNIGVAQARGQWIAFLDADDIWHPRKLELQLKVLHDKGGVFACSGMLDFRDASNIRFDEIDSVQVTEVSFVSQRLKGRIPTSSVVLRTDVAREFPFREEPSYKAVEDYDCWLRILQAHGTCHKLTHTLLMYRLIAGQISGSKLLNLKRVHHVHRRYPRTSSFGAVFYSITHAIGGVYYRVIRGRL